MATGGSREQGKTAEDPGRLSSRLAPYADIILKLTPALLTAAGTWLVVNYQSQNAGTSLLNQREQAETQLRATMFANLIGPIAGQQRDRPLSPEDERLLVELLTLNFHEHIEFKPLLVHADARLVQKQKLAKSSAARDALEEMRRSLRSAVRRVRDRQLAVLQKECGKKSRLCPDASLAARYQCEPPARPEPPAEAKRAKPPAGPLNRNPQCLSFSPPVAIGSRPSPHVAVSPDGKYELSLWLDRVDWNNELFKINVNVRSGGARGVGTAFDFTLTPFDLPFTDNTIVDRDHRFALALKDSLQQINEVEIWVVWFPEGYILPHERPVNFQEIRKVLKLE